MLCYACGGDIRHGLCVHEMKASKARKWAGLIDLNREFVLRIRIRSHIDQYPNITAASPAAGSSRLLHRIRAEGLDRSSSQVAIRT